MLTQDTQLQIKKKILYIIQLPPPVHGVSVMNDCIVKSQILNNTFDSKIIDLKFGESIKDLESFSLKKVYKTFKFAFQIIRNLNVYKPDLVYFTISPIGFAFYRDAIFIFFIKLFKTKILVHLHGKGIEKNITGSPLKKRTYKYTFKNINVICLSDLLANDIKNIYSSTPFIIPNGIKSAPSDICVQNQKITNSIPQILYLSNYIRNKGILVLVDALSLLNNQGIIFEAKLVGAPSNISVEYLQHKINNLGLSSRIKVIGPLSGNDKYKAYQEADIFVFPTFNDAFPLVNLEAMQFHLPIVSTFEGSIPDIIIDNHTGYLVERENAEMLAEKIALLVKDKDLRKNMGENGHNRYINNYTLDQFESNLYNTLQQVMNT